MIVHTSHNTPNSNVHGISRSMYPEYFSNVTYVGQYNKCCTSAANKEKNEFAIGLKEDETFRAVTKVDDFYTSRCV
ncbi:MAG: hypothetical protein WA667_30525 [Candidatus Nitrosopolaris sp.]